MCKKCGGGIKTSAVFKSFVPEGTETLVITQVLPSSKKYYKNPKTGNVYQFGGNLQEIEVAKEDADFLLNMSKFGKRVFALNLEATKIINSDVYGVSENAVQEEEKREEKREAVVIVSTIDEPKEHVVYLDSSKTVGMGELVEPKIGEEDTEEIVVVDIIDYSHEVTIEDENVIEELIKSDIEKKSKGRKKKLEATEE